MCSRGSSQIIKIVLVMLISGILLSEKHSKKVPAGSLVVHWSLRHRKRYQITNFDPLKVRQASSPISDRLLSSSPTKTFSTQKQKMWFANYELSVSPRKIHVNWLFAYKYF